MKKWERIANVTREQTRNPVPYTTTATTLTTTATTLTTTEVTGTTICFDY